MTGGTEQHRIHSKRSTDAKELSDVVDVVDVIGDEHRAWRRRGHVVAQRDGLEGRALTNGEHSAMEVDAGELLDGRVTGGVENRRTFSILQQFAHALEHARAREHRDDRVAPCEHRLQHDHGLTDEDALACAEVALANVAIERYSWISGTVNVNSVKHERHCCGFRAAAHRACPLHSAHEARGS